MTPNEAKESLGEVILIAAVGKGKGYKQVEVYDVDIKEKTAWGRGSIKFVDLDDPKKRRVACCLTQVELYVPKKIKRNSVPSRRRVRRKEDSTQTSDTRKRQRNSKGRRRRRS